MTEGLLDLRTAGVGFTHRDYPLFYFSIENTQIYRINTFSHPKSYLDLLRRQTFDMYLLFAPANDD